MKRIILFLLFTFFLLNTKAQSDTYIDRKSGIMEYVEYQKPTYYEIADSNNPPYLIETNFVCHHLMTLPLDSLKEKTIILNGQKKKINTYYLVSLGTPKLILKGREFDKYELIGYYTIIYTNCRYLKPIVIKGSVDVAKESVMNDEICYIHLSRHKDGYLEHKIVLCNREYDIFNY